MIFIKQKHLL